jgi:hypothetical protein
MGDRVLSPDGQWMWTGSEWIPAPPSASAIEPQIGSVQDSVLQTGDLVRGAKIDTVIIHQSPTQAPVPNPSPPVVPVQQQECPNCRQMIAPGVSRLLRCQAGSCGVEFCTGCEVWWTGTPRPEVMAPQCREHHQQTQLSKLPGMINRSLTPINYSFSRYIVPVVALVSIEFFNAFSMVLTNDDDLGFMFLWPATLVCSLAWSIGPVQFNIGLGKAISFEIQGKHFKALAWLKSIERSAYFPFFPRSLREKLNVSPRLSDQYRLRYKL